jgi:hypothetical protein
MLKFKSFLIETLLVEKALSSSVSSDDKGKLHELLLSKHLHPNNTLPEHHRSESENEDHAGTPQQVHDRLKKKIGDAAYNEIDSHSKSTADALKKHLVDSGHLKPGHTIGNVHWTSNADKENKAGDHEKTTGIKDVNSNADLIITMHDKDGKVVGHHGVSAKYGTNKEPNYRNPGLDSLEKTANLPSGSLNAHMKTHHAGMEKLGYNGSAEDRHAQYKADSADIEDVRKEHGRLSGILSAGKKLSAKEKTTHKHFEMFLNAHDKHKNPDQFLQAAKSRAAAAEESARIGKQALAKKFAEGLSKYDDAKLRNVVRDHVSAPTKIPHTVAHSHVQDDGSSKPIIKPASEIADKHLEDYENLHVVHSGGIAVYIKGTHKKTGKVMNVGTMTMKGSSGPHKGVVGAFSLK